MKSLNTRFMLISKDGLYDFTYDPHQFSLATFNHNIQSKDFSDNVPLNTVLNYVISVSVDFEEESRVSPFKRYIPKPGTAATRSA